MLTETTEDTEQTPQLISDWLEEWEDDVFLPSLYQFLNALKKLFNNPQSHDLFSSDTVDTFKNILNKSHDLITIGEEQLKNSLPVRCSASLQTLQETYKLFFLGYNVSFKNIQSCLEALDSLKSTITESSDAVVEPTNDFFKLLEQLRQMNVSAIEEKHETKLGYQLSIVKDALMRFLESPQKILPILKNSEGRLLSVLKMLIVHEAITAGLKLTGMFPYQTLKNDLLKFDELNPQLKTLFERIKNNNTRDRTIEKKIWRSLDSYFVEFTTNQALEIASKLEWPIMYSIIKNQNLDQTISDIASFQIAMLKIETIQRNLSSLYKTDGRPDKDISTDSSFWSRLYCLFKIFQENAHLQNVIKNHLTSNRTVALYVTDIHANVRMTAILKQETFPESTLGKGGYCAGGILSWNTYSSSLHLKNPVSKEILTPRLLYLQHNRMGHTLDLEIDTDTQTPPPATFKDSVTCLMNAILNQLKTIAPLYYYQATFLLMFLHRDWSHAHAVGFKIVQRTQENGLEKTFYLFRDYNTGEFETDNIDDFSIFLQHYFVLYYREGLYDFELKIIKPNLLGTHPFSQTSELFSDAVIHNKPLTRNPALLSAFKVFKDNADTNELQDNALRKEQRLLLAPINHYKEFMAAADRCFALHRQIKNKNKTDYIAIICILFEKLCYYSENHFEEKLNFLKNIEHEIIELIRLDSSNSTINIKLFVYYAEHYLNHSTSDSILKESDVFQYLKKFYEEVKKIKQETLVSMTGYDTLLELNSTIEKWIHDASATTVSWIAVAKIIQQLKTLVDNSSIWVPSDPELIKHMTLLVYAEEKGPELKKLAMSGL